MHQRIIWTLFFTAFILDIFRIRSESTIKKPIPPKINKQTEPQVNSHIQNEEKKYLEKEDDDFEEDEDLKVVDNFKKKKKKNKMINLRIEFCQSWSHRGYFNQVKQHLESNYTNINVQPSDYPLSTQRKLLSYIVTFIQFGGIILAFTGKNIKTYIGSIIPDNALDWIEGNKMMFGMGCYLIGNILNNKINNAGAFEIYCNEELIWSAINNNKKVPNLEGIIMMINKYGGKLLKR